MLATTSHPPPPRTPPNNGPTRTVLYGLLPDRSASRLVAVVVAAATDRSSPTGGVGSARLLIGILVLLAIAHV
jgi:hypothetical protein